MSAPSSGEAKLGVASGEQASVHPTGAAEPVQHSAPASHFSFHIPDRVLEKAPDSSVLPAAQSGLLDTGVLPANPSGVSARVEEAVVSTPASEQQNGAFDRGVLADRLRAAQAADAAAQAASAAANATTTLRASPTDTDTNGGDAPHMNGGTGATATPAEKKASFGSQAGSLPRASTSTTTPRSILKKSGSKPSRPLVWTAEVRQFSRDAHGQVHNVEDCMAAMREGTWFTKIRGSKALARRLRYDPEQRAIAWLSSRTSALRFIPLAAIKAVARGKRCNAFRQKKLLGAEEKLCFSIVHNADGKHDELPLIAETENAIRQWVVGLRHLMGEQQGAHAYPSAVLAWLQTMFSEADADKDGRLNQAESQAALVCLLPRDDPALIARKLASFNELKRGTGTDVSLTFADFSELQSHLCNRPEILALLDEYASPAAQCLTRAQLQDFLVVDQQTVWANDEYCDELIDLFESTPEGKRDRLLGVHGFTRMLHATFPLAAAQPALDLSLPLTAYYIAASHNTFLLKDQLKGPSGTEGYTAALARGCRVVDVDVWDGEDGQPVVYNGYTSTGRVALRDVMAAIAANAFVKTDLPLLVYFENHCEVEQQALVVSILQSSIGSILFKIDAAQLSLPLPPLAELTGKVLLVSKRLKDEAAGDAEISEDDEAEPHDARRKKRNKGRASAGDGLDQPAKQPYKLSSALSALVALPSTRLDETLARRTEPWTVSSIDDAKAAKVVEANSAALVQYTATRLVRVYPSAVRVNSENFESPSMWTHGVQIVGMNTQTQDLALRTHWGLFHQSNGYALKPRRLRRRFTAFCPEQPGQSRHAAKKYSVEVISAQHLPLPDSSRNNIVDPFICVAVDGLPCDSSRQTSKAVDNNDYDPMFGETFAFSVACPDLATLSLIVLDDSRIGDNFIGQFTCPLRLVQPGYRHAPLLDRHGVPVTGSSVFVKISIAGSSETSIPGLVYAATNLPTVSGLPAVETVISDLETLRTSSAGAAAAFLQAAQRNNLAAALERLTAVMTPNLTGTDKALALSIPDGATTGRPLAEALGKLLEESQNTIATCERLENELDAALRHEPADHPAGDKVAQLYNALDAVRDAAADNLVIIKAALLKAVRTQRGL